MLSIFKREFLSYFRTPMFYVILVVYLICSALTMIFMGGYLDINNTDLVSFFSTQPQVLVIVVPALSMRLWADEYRFGTDELLLTLPLSYWQIVLGKFAACLSIGIVLLLSTLPLLVFTSLYYSLDGLIVTGGYAALLLVVASLGAIGLFVSSLAKNIISIYLVSVMACFSLVYINFDFLIARAGDGLMWYKIMNSFNFYKHYIDMISGDIGIGAVVYFVSISAGVLWANKVFVEQRNS